MTEKNAGQFTLANFFVTQMLTRNLFALANLLVLFRRLITTLGWIAQPLFDVYALQRRPCPAGMK